MKKFYLLGLIACLCGCTTASRTTTAKDGSVTKTTISTFLTTVTGFSDSVTSPDGIESITTLANYAGDVNTINALGNILLQGVKAGATLAGNTNLVLSTTNLFVARPPK
jgi:hypothetical protein